MRVLFFLLLTLACSAAWAGDTYYYVYGDPSNPQTPHYATVDDACIASDADYTAFYKTTDFSQPGPYVAPTYSNKSVPPKYIYYDCPYSATNVKNQNVLHTSRLIQQILDTCGDGKTLNPQTGLCESPDQDQKRKEAGDPSDGLMSGVVMCGDPINVGNGNVFESETDYADADGELRFARSYNSSLGGWAFTYSTSLYIDPKGIVITFDDGRAAIFSLSNGVATPEPTELGSLTLVNGSWVYRSPSNEQFTFNASGRLTQWVLANGLAQTLSYTTSPTTGATTATVTDSRGHTLQFTALGRTLNSLSVGGLTITYGVDTSYRLATVTRAWSGHQTSRTYIYDDATNPRLLTGIVDERGIRSATWAYDNQGRAISNQRAIGADKTTIAYNTDGTTTVTNALGNSATYTYQIIQGVKRVTAVAGQPAVGCPASNSSYTYTTNGQVQSKTDALGTVTTYTYDTLGRELTRTEAKGTPQERTTTTTWDATRFLPLTVTTSDRVITYTYDAQGRPLGTSVHATKE